MEKSNHFSGWRVLVGCFLVMFLVQGGLQTFAVFMPSIAKDTGWSVSSVAIVSTTATIGAFLANMSIGTIIKKIGARMVLVIGILFLIGHWCLYSLSASVYVLWIAGFLGGAAIGFGTMAPCSIIMTNWFVKNRSQYVAIVVAAAMFGSTVINPLAGRLISQFGWRNAYFIQAGILGTIAMLTVLFLIVDSPEKRGQLAYGAGESLASSSAKSDVVIGGVDLQTARSSLSFWLMLAGIMIIGMSTNIENFIPAFWQRGRGMEATTSANLMGVYAFLAAVGSIVMSKINDKLGGKMFVFITSCLFAAATLIMAYTGVVAITPLLVVILIPLALGCKKASSLLPPLVVAEAFGRKFYSSIIGIYAAMLQLGIAISNPIIGALLESSGGYEVPFTVMVVCNLAGMLLIFVALVRKPYKVDKAGAAIQ